MLPSYHTWTDLSFLSWTMYNYALCLLPFVIYTVALPVDFEAHAPPLPDLAALEPLPDHVSHAPLPSAGTDAPLPDLEADESIPDLKARKPLPDLGVPQWSCDPAVMAKSKEVPKSVHSVRFADIKVFAALGDSLSAGNGANARGPLGLLKEFRGVSFVGGDMTLEEHITIPNVLRKFNPNLFGYSTGTGKWNSWKVSESIPRY
ncbi:hypothetical protein TELCIR_18049 [Teladorsagia circumcincta]|uniref:Triacylglycerol lipase n=1 Tax=Teladorsagia circumcincta TaxID=45464 RepID=A0A2G9TSK7_TELCI|nr:hypothetical protein TELCIR_18049 [Teladorsagia circumcincta]